MLYTKKLAEIEITTLDGATFAVTDTIECPVASSALTSLQSGKGAYVQVEGDAYYIPASAVSNIKISYSDSDAIYRPDPYGCEE